jgi:hypothetical protein
MMRKNAERRRQSSSAATPFFDTRVYGRDFYAAFDGWEVGTDDTGRWRLQPGYLRYPINTLQESLVFAKLEYIFLDIAFAALRALCASCYRV